MAGLVRTSNRKSTGCLPIFPSGDMSSVTPYYSYDGHEGAYVHLPAFTGAANSSSIRILQNSTTSFGATLYNIDGTAASNGVWASGMTIAEGAGSSNADRFVSAYMDTADQLWYMLFIDTSTSPDTLYFSKVNEAGTVTAIGNAALGATSLDGMWFAGTYTGVLFRKGGDGSGDFAIYNSNTSGGAAVASVPYRGAKITISASDGSLSYENFMPTTYGAYAATSYRPILGPTANGIVGSQVYNHTYSNQPGFGAYGSISNTVTGRNNSYCYWGSPENTGYPWGLASMVFMRARKKYVFATYGNVFYGSSIFDEDEVHSWLDEMAVHYGVL